jgi:hypothetical protein
MVRIHSPPAESPLRTRSCAGRKPGRELTAYQVGCGMAPLRYPRHRFPPGITSTRSRRDPQAGGGVGLILRH